MADPDGHGGGTAELTGVELAPELTRYLPYLMRRAAGDQPDDHGQADRPAAGRGLRHPDPQPGQPAFLCAVADRRRPCGTDPDAVLGAGARPAPDGQSDAGGTHTPQRAAAYRAR